MKKSKKVDISSTLHYNRIAQPNRKGKHNNDRI
nr:MAG TPA: hypothetical protein [Caudoviricetes sp.]